MSADAQADIGKQIFQPCFRGCRVQDAGAPDFSQNSLARPVHCVGQHSVQYLNTRFASRCVRETGAIPACHSAGGANTPRVLISSVPCDRRTPVPLPDRGSRLRFTGG